MGKAYILVVLGILMAKGFGFFREIIFASVFGATVYTDMYFQIFGLVNLIFTGIGVALSTLVIKNVNKISAEKPGKCREYVSMFITRTILISTAAMLVLYLLSPQIVRLLLPGLDVMHFGFALKLMYIMLPSMVFVLVAYVISGVLQNSGVFFVSSVMSLPFNIIIIISLLMPHADILTVAVFTTIGWFLHIVVQLPKFYKKGYRMLGRIKAYGLARNSTGGEMVCIFISNMLFQLCFTIDKAFVSVESGAATTLNYASNLFVTISSVFVVAISNVLFPTVSRNYEKGNTDYVRNLIQYIIKLMLAIFLPFVLTVSLFGDNIIGLLYQRGEFTAEHTRVTSLIFAIYSLGFLGYICQEFFNKILYLDGRYKNTVIGTVLVLILKIAANIYAMDIGGVVGVALTTVVLLILYALSIFKALTKLTGKYLTRALIADILKLVLSCMAALVMYFIFKNYLPSVTGGKLSFIIALGACGGVYIGMLIVTGMFSKLMAGDKE